MSNMPIPKRYGDRLSGDDYAPLVDQNPELNHDYYPPAPTPLYGQPPSIDGTKPLVLGGRDVDLRAGGGRTPSPTPSEVMALNGESPPMTTRQKVSK